jgi:hypothetical protein
MDEFQDGYQADDNYGVKAIEEGDYALKIQNITFEPSQAGNPMITAHLITRESPIVFKHYIVKNDYFNANMTKFFDCFKIPRGNFEYQRWLGRVGKGHIAKGDIKSNGKAYMEIKYLIVDAPAAKPGPQQATQPAAQPAPAPTTRQQYQAPAREPEPVGAMPFTDDIPF